MDRTRKARITIETERLMTVSRGRSVIGMCDLCGREAEMVSPERAAAASGVSQRTIFRRIEDGSLHFAETADRTLLVCAESLSTVFGPE